MSYRSIKPYGVWAESILGWHKRIREDAALGQELVRFFQLAAEWLPKYTYEQALFGVAGDNINIIVGNVWLASMGLWHGGRLCLMVNRPDLNDMPLAAINGGPNFGFKFYPWADVADLNKRADLWLVYAEATEGIWNYPVARQTAAPNKRGRQQLSAVMEIVNE